MKNTLIAGYGYLGTTLAHELARHNYRVWTLGRSAKPGATGTGVSFIQADLTNPATLKNLPSVDSTVFCAAPNEHTPDAYRKIYIEGVRNLLDAWKHVGAGSPRPLIYISSTSVYGQNNGSWVDENSPTAPASETGKILLEAEKQVLGAGIPAIVLRLGGIYGPGRNRIEALKTGTFEVSDPDAFVNLIHVDDAAGAVLLLLEKGKSGEIYLGVDNEPVLRREYFSWLTGKLGIESPRAVESTGARGKRCRNSKLISLGFRYKYPTFREGYKALISV